MKPGGEILIFLKFPILYYNFVKAFISSEEWLGTIIGSAFKINIFIDDLVMSQISSHDEDSIFWLWPWGMDVFGDPIGSGWC